MILSQLGLITTVGTSKVEPPLKLDPVGTTKSENASITGHRLSLRAVSLPCFGIGSCPPDCSLDAAIGRLGISQSRALAIRLRAIGIAQTLLCTLLFTVGLVVSAISLGEPLPILGPIHLLIGGHGGLALYAAAFVVRISAVCSMRHKSETGRLQESNLRNRFGIRPGVASTTPGLLYTYYNTLAARERLAFAITGIAIASEITSAIIGGFSARYTPATMPGCSASSMP